MGGSSGWGSGDIIQCHIRMLGGVGGDTEGMGHGWMVVRHTTHVVLTNTMFPPTLCVHTRTCTRTYSYPYR